MARAWTTFCAHARAAGRSLRRARGRDRRPETDVDDSVDEEGEAPRRCRPGRPIQIAVIGRPNAGKSTLINAILGEERLLTGPEAGITRDAIAVQRRLAGHADPDLRHRRDAQEGEGPGEAREAVGLRRAARGEVRRGGGRASRRAISPSRRRICGSPTSPSARGGRWWSRSTSGISKRRSRKAQRALREALRPAAAATQGRADGHGLGADRQGARPAARGDPEGVCGLEQADLHGAAEPLAGVR